MADNEHYVSAMPEHRFGAASLQEFDEDHNPVGPLFWPISDLYLVSKQMEIVRRVRQKMLKLPYPESRTEEPVMFSPVIGVHMKVVDPHMDFDGHPENTGLYNLKTQNMRFQRFTDKAIFENIYVEIYLDDDAGNQPILKAFAPGWPRLSYAIGMGRTQFEALLRQIETSARCLITLTLDRPAGIYIASWREPAKLLDGYVSFRKPDGTHHDGSKPLVGPAKAINLRISTFPEVPSVKRVFGHDTDDAYTDDTEILDAGERLGRNTPQLQKQLEVAPIDPGSTRPADARTVKLILTLIVIMLVVIAIRI